MLVILLSSWSLAGAYRQFTTLMWVPFRTVPFGRTGGLRCRPCTVDSSSVSFILFLYSQAFYYGIVLTCGYPPVRYLMMLAAVVSGLNFLTFICWLV